MAIRNLRYEGDPILRKTSKEVKEVTPKIRELIDDMLETMYEANGVGLAAPQVGVLKRIVVIDVGEGPLVMVNPQVVRTAEMTDIKCIVFVRGKRPGEDILKLARDRGMVIMTTGERMYSACGLLYTHGLPGS